MAHPGGRPTIINDLVLKKLEEVFALGGTDKEACFYAGISHQTLYNYQEKNPEFVERKEMLKQSPVLLARRTIVDKMTEDVNTARWYVERRDRDFNPKQEVDITSMGDKIMTGESEIALLAKEAAAILKEHDTDTSATSST